MQSPSYTLYRRIDTDLVLLIPPQQVLYFPFLFTHYWRIYALRLFEVSAYRLGGKGSLITRITGGGFASSGQETEFTEKLAAKQKTNHRVLGKQMLLFATDPSIGQGMIV